MKAIHDAMLSYWGERCPAHDPDCSACQAWDQYDAVQGKPEQTNTVLECSTTQEVNVKDITEAKTVWRGMVATYKNMQDRVHNVCYGKHSTTGQILEARGLVLQATTTMDRMADQLEQQFPDYEFNLTGKFIRRAK